MRKLSELNENKPTSIESEIKRIIESSEIEFDGVETPWNNKVSVKVNENDIKEIKNLFENYYNQEKMRILEKSKQIPFTRDISWISDEIEKINKKNDN